jgi:hypothetical protein
MSSRAANQTALERRIRRLVVRRGLSMLVAQKPDPKVRAHGGYMLRDDATRAVVFGDKGYAFSATLEEIEAFLTAEPPE